MIQTLTRILLSEGSYWLVAIKKPLPLQHSFYNTLEELQDIAEKLLSNVWDVFYGCATFKDGSSRKAFNALLVKSFWLDLVCGQGKPFDSQATALKALKSFCEATNLPKPTLVNSGNVVHVYWILKEAITPDLWVLVAEGLQRLCKDSSFDADPAVAADVVRLLIVPDSLSIERHQP